MADINVKSRDSNVQKIVIQAFKQKPVNGSSPSPFNTFTVPINPENLSQKFEIKQENQQASGNQGTSGKYVATLPEELRLDFYLDNTNTVSGNVLQGTIVPEQVRQLLEVVYKMESESHRPNFLKIAWNNQELFGPNKFVFDCQLKSLDIQYVLFNRGGEPLRAKVSAVFSAYVEDKKRTREEGKGGKESPDLTHVRTATPGDRLWLMTQRIYESTTPLLQVALLNDLTTFRQLETGKEIFFAPYDRTEA